MPLLLAIYLVWRSSYLENFQGIIELKYFTNFLGKHVPQVFHVNIVKFLRTSFLQNTSGGCFFSSLIDAYSETSQTSKMYEMQLSHIFQILSISNENPSISIEIPRYFESDILKYQVLCILNLKYQVFRMKYLVFQKNCEIPGFQWTLCMFPSISFLSLRIRSYQVNIIRLRSLINKNIRNIC